MLTSHLNSSLITFSERRYQNVECLIKRAGVSGAEAVDMRRERDYFHCVRRVLFEAGVGYNGTTLRNS